MSIQSRCDDCVKCGYSDRDDTQMRHRLRENRNESRRFFKPQDGKEYLGVEIVNGEKCKFVERVK